MFADPQSLTIGSALSLPRIGTGLNSGSFQTADGLVVLKNSHLYGKRTRRTIRVDHSKIAADPLIAAQNLKYSTSVYLVVDAPPVGYTPADITSIVTGLFTNLTASTNANLIKFLGGES